MLFLWLMLGIGDAAVGSLMLWSPDRIEVSALGEFGDEDFRSLLEKGGYGQVVGFAGRSMDSAKVISKLLSDRYQTTYIPEADVSVKFFENVYELSGSKRPDTETARKILHNQQLKDSNFIVAYRIHPSLVRQKRKAKSNKTAEVAEEMDYEDQPPPTGPVLYSAENKQDGNEAMIYSSRPLLLKTNATTYVLGSSTSATVDSRGTYIRLIATVPIEGGKVTLRFKFPWQGGYWSLFSVEVEGLDAKQYSLTLSGPITAPRRFSYHCAGEIVFRDAENGLELSLYDVQAQPDTRRRRFSNAYDCVPFTTGPIWSGIFTVLVLLAGLTVGLVAIGSIKTMDKFDNHKTKQLTITVWE